MKPDMDKLIVAVYENGVLRPLQPLPLAERQEVRLSISMPSSDEVLSEWLDHQFMQEVDAILEAGPEPTLKEVREALSKVPGNLSVDIRAERDARG